MKWSAVLFVLALLFAPAFAEYGIIKVVQSPVSPSPGDVVRFDIYIKNFEDDDISVDLNGGMIAANNSGVIVKPLNNHLSHLESYGVGTMSFNVLLPSDGASSYGLTYQLFSGYRLVEKRDLSVLISQDRDLALNATLPTIPAGECRPIQVRLSSPADISDAYVSLSGTLPFILNGTEYPLGDLHAGETTNLSIPVCTYDDTYAGVYSILTTARWREKGASRTKYVLASTQVSSYPRIALSSLSLSPERADSHRAVEVSVFLQNLRSEPAFSVEIEPDPRVCDLNSSADRFSIKTPLYRGIGGKASFTCSHLRGAGNITLPLLVRYRDRFGADHNQSIELPLQIYDEPHLVIANYSTRIGLDGKMTLDVALLNDGSAPARHADMVLDIEWPFSTEQKRDYVDAIPVGQTRNTTFVLNLYSNAETKHYGIGSTLNYQDADDNTFSDTQTISASVQKVTWTDYALHWASANALYVVVSVLFIVVVVYFAFFASRKK